MYHWCVPGAVTQTWCLLANAIPPGEAVLLVALSLAVQESWHHAMLLLLLAEVTPCPWCPLTRRWDPHSVWFNPFFDLLGILLRLSAFISVFFFFLS